MKKRITIVSIGLLALTGCADKNIKYDEQNLVDISQVVADPSANVGKSVDFMAKVHEVKQVDDITLVTAYTADDLSTDEVTIKVEGKDIDQIKTGDYLNIKGVDIENDNSKDKALIKAKDFEEVSYITAASPTDYSIKINKKQKQRRLVIKLDKLEQAKKENRLYVTINNKSNKEIALSEYNFSLIVDGVTYDYQANDEANYQELPEGIAANSKVDAIIPFDNVDLENASTIEVKISDVNTSDYKSQYKDIEFNIKK